MGWLFKSKAELDEHERAHQRAYRGQGISGRVVNRKGTPVMQGSIGGGKRGARKGAIALAAGAMAGGGDSGGDWKAVKQLAKEAGMSVDEVKRQARRYVR